MLLKWPDQKPHLSPYSQPWFSTTHQRVFNHFIKPQCNVLELGSWVGDSTRYLCSLPTKHVYCVDTWKGGAEHQCEKYAKILPIILDQFIYNMWDYRHKVSMYQNDTVDALMLLYKQNVNIDFIYIDASHKYQDVYYDCVLSYLYWPNAFIIGDDWMVSLTGVRQAVLDFADKYNLRLKVIGNVWWVDK